MKHKGPMWTLVFSPDERYLASAGNEIVVLWDVSTEHAVTRYNLAGAYTAAFTRDGLLVTQGEDVIIWKGRKIAKKIRFPPQKPYRINDIFIDETNTIWIFCELDIFYWHYGMKRAKATRAPLADICWGYLSPDRRLLIIMKKKLASPVHVHDHATFIIYFLRDDLSEIFRREICVKDYYKITSLQPLSKDCQHFFLPNGRLIRTHDLKSLSAFLDCESPDKFLLWYNRLPIVGDFNVLISPFVGLHEDIRRVALSRRGFLALGYENGTIEVIREGKEI